VILLFILIFVKETKNCGVVDKYHVSLISSRTGALPATATNLRINYPETDRFETVGMIMVYGAQEIKYENGQYPLKKLIRD
jgi:hypothetical protein